MFKLSKCIMIRWCMIPKLPFSDFLANSVNLYFFAGDTGISCNTKHHWQI